MRKRQVNFYAQSPHLLLAMWAKSLMLFYFFTEQLRWCARNMPRFVAFLAICLQACDPKAWQTMAVNLPLPTEEFLSSDTIALTCIFKAK